MNKLWQKEIPIDKAVEAFTIGRDPEFDVLLAKYDVLGNIAHAQMLSEIELLTEEEFTSLHAALRSIYTKIEQGQFYIEEGVEDVHSQIEFLLTEKLGEVGKKIHAARSRNDQVLVDLKMYFRDAIYQLSKAHERLFTLLTDLAEKHKNKLLPGYTHLQAAMPSSFGLWFSAFAENLVDDLNIWSAVFKNINQNPLGSGAGYGVSLPIQRKVTTELLGFADLNYNVIHAQMSRGRSELFMSMGICSTANTLSKLAMDVCLYNGQDMGFIKLADAFTTGSSIMPHKKNPDVFELIRARCNQLCQLPSTIAATIGHLPSGYHRDFQLLKELVFPAIDQLLDVLRMTLLALQHIEVKSDILDADKYKPIFSVEWVNKMVLEGTPFREAYQKVGRMAEKGQIEKPATLQHTHEGSMGELSLAEMRKKLSAALAEFDFSYKEKISALLE